MLITAIHKDSLAIVRNAARSKLSEDWITVSEEFINSVPSKYWKFDGQDIVEMSQEEKDVIDFADIKQSKLNAIDQWIANKSQQGIEVTEGIILPSTTDSAVQLQVYLGTLSENETIVVTDINGNPQLINPSNLLSYITNYQTEFKTRRITWATIKAAINGVTTLAELNAINIPE